MWGLTCNSHTTVTIFVIANMVWLQKNKRVHKFVNKHITYKLYIVLLPELVCTLYINIRQIKLLHVYINKLLLLADMKARGGGGTWVALPLNFR